MEEYIETECTVFNLASTHKFEFCDIIFTTVNCILPGGTIIICICKLLNKGTSNSCIYACMKIIQHTLIDEFYAQSAIALFIVILKFILLIYRNY